MAPARRHINGRSPLVNKQSQITTFFSKSSSPPSPPLTKQSPKLAPANPSPNEKPDSSPSHSPTTPSPLQSKLNKPKPVLVIPSAPVKAAAAKSYRGEVVGKRIKVYWPLDEAWYEGCVKSFDGKSKKHLIQYDDAEEELLDLGKEKTEWIEESPRQFKRLRRGGGGAALEKAVVAVVEDVESDGSGDNAGAGDDDSSDEEWQIKNGEKEVEEDMDMDLVDEDEEDDDNGDDDDGGNDDDAGKRSGGKSGGKQVSRKRKACIGGKELVLGKKSKSGAGGLGKEGCKVSSAETGNNISESEGKKTSNGLASSLPPDVSERFGLREAEKLKFLGPARRDAKKRRPGDVDYDPKTLYLPPDFLKSLSGGQRQWWEFKSKHMDKVLFFKMGKFYELFEMDAHVGARELDLQYMKGEQPHCGFPERNFSMNVEKLARKGYRVLVVEQTETPEQLEIRRKEKGSKDKVVKREICGVTTKGTLTEGELLSANPEASYLMSVTESSHTYPGQKAEQILGICLVDVATSKIVLGQITDDLDRSALCCLLTEVRPVEIIKPFKALSAETERVLLTHTRAPLVNELVPGSEFWDSRRTISELKAIYKRVSNMPDSACSDEADKLAGTSYVEDKDESSLPETVSKLVNSGENGSFALSALGGAIYYLRQAFLDETLLRFAKFESLPCSRFTDLAQNHLVLDAAALENLEIFENSRNGGSSGTLYAQLNHCVTACGKRMLKTWLARPLYNREAIKERQDAIADLRGESLSSVLEFRRALSKIPDMERLLARIFASSEACGRNANKVILYEDAAKKRLIEFISTLRGCEVLAQACSSVRAILENVESGRLHYLLTPGRGLPDVDSILRHFKDAFDWVEANKSGRIIPHEGVDVEYDSACNTIKEIESKLTKHLKEQRKLLGDTSITYVSVGKEAHLLEVPESLRGSIPRDYELRSSKKGFFRYWNPTIKKLLSELSQAESEKESALKSILHRLIQRFCEHHNKWRQLVSATAELDVLISLAIASDYFEGPTCRPAFTSPSCPTEGPLLSTKSLGHPVLRSDSLGKGTFVPNDIDIGGTNAMFILLSGPNMGGKSTLLRQVCLSVILAQIGANVPAESFVLSPVDRIFVRMGAKDHIMAGQSTFLTELSETALMLTSATRNSFVALDELGRGTATSDGQAIAESVLEHFVHKVQCRGMFSTHYHRLAVNYKDDPGVSLRHMACQVGDGADGMEEVTFLYRLTPGACPKSYGVNVARLAGLPELVLRKAALKSIEFEDSYGVRGNGHGGDSCSCYSNDETVFIQKLTRVLANTSRCGLPQGAGLGYLIELQHNARMLLQKN
ncbi:DNA mismatch repair protein MSH6 [Punica granatum]|uniref:DNA mismatch repair protein n=1 Tax=Punica granatum TaxID=22663 RepID=A0A6P8BTW0_PUNGR|nr:DNA mismatch repair protein MSH6 [Punica granatum]